MNRTLKRLWNAVTTLLVVIVVLLALLLVGARVIGLQVYAVLSGSMEPTYQTGSLIYVKDVDPDTLEAGDVITFMVSEDTIATHRIVAPVPSETEEGLVRYRTKGDANDAEDGTLVHPQNIIGTPVFTIPYLGYVANYIQQPPGTYVAICGAAFLILLVFVPDILSAADKADKRSAEKKAAKAGGEGDKPEAGQ